MAEERKTCRAGFLLETWDWLDQRVGSDGELHDRAVEISDTNGSKKITCRPPRGENHGQRYD
jgi:hypothetical protein